VAAAHRLLERCQTWLAEADPGGVLDLQRSSQDKAEEGLGRYKAPVLLVEHGDTRVYIVPFARNTTRSLRLPSGQEVRTAGRIDVTNGVEKQVLYRVEAGGKERWYVAPERGDVIALNQDVFMALMEDLLS
jgi:hypothetical protein